MTAFKMDDIFVCTAKHPDLQHLSIVRTHKKDAQGVDLYQVVRNPPSGMERSPELTPEAVMRLLVSLLDDHTVNLQGGRS